MLSTMTCFKIGFHLESPMSYPFCPCVFSYEKYRHLGFDDLGKGIPLWMLPQHEVFFGLYQGLYQALVCLALLQHCLHSFDDFWHIYQDCQICHGWRVGPFFDKVLSFILHFPFKSLLFLPPC